MRASWARPGLPLQLFSGQGYFVFMPNPRGFADEPLHAQQQCRISATAILEDILAGVDAVEKSYPVDDKRIGIAGWSLDGYMTMWTGHSDAPFPRCAAGQASRTGRATTDRTESISG